MLPLLWVRNPLQRDLYDDRRFESNCSKVDKSALQLSHRSWTKPGLASGRSPDSRFYKLRTPSQNHSSGRISARSRSQRLQLRGSGGITPRFPNSRYLFYNELKMLGQTN